MRAKPQGEVFPPVCREFGGPLTLSKQELRELTSFKACAQQIRELTFMDIPFRTTTTGEIKVLRSDVILRDTIQRDLTEEPDYGALTS